MILAPSIPRKSALPKEKKRDSVRGVPNFAGNEETNAKVLARIKSYFGYYESQNVREEFETDLKDGDAMLRMAKNQTKQDDNKTLDSTDTVPEIYFRDMRTITDNETSILYDGPEAPVKFMPLTNLSDADRVQAKANADKQNLLLEYSMEADNREEKLRLAQWSINKYANQVFTMGWKHVEHKVKTREPSGFDEEGMPSGFEMKTSTKVESHPEFKSHDIADTWFDGLIDDIQNQQCILLRSRPVYASLLRRQAAGEWMNISKVTSAQLYEGDEPDDVREDRHENAEDQGDESMITGDYENFTVWLRAPINDDGKWDEKGTPERWMLVELIGNPYKQNTVVVKNSPNPFRNLDGFDGEIPVILVHSHQDDKGAFHKGYVNLARPVYQEYKTTMDQWFENKNLINNAPWKVGQGALHNSDHTFGPHREFIMRPGKFDQLERLNVPSNTGDMQAFISYLEQKMHDVMAATTAFRGEAMGARTSASEARNALDQSLRPALAKLRYVADQLLPWMALWDAAMYRQFAPVDLMISLVHGGGTQEIKPAELWGPLRARVLVIDEYRRNTLSDLEEDRFIATSLPLFAEVMGKRGMIETGKHIFRRRILCWNRRPTETRRRSRDPHHHT